MEAPGGVGGGRDARFLPYNVGLLEPDLYAPLRAPLQPQPQSAPSPLLPSCPRGLKRNTDCYEERAPPPHHPHHQQHHPQHQQHHQQQQQQQHHQQQQQQHMMEPCGVPELGDEYAPLAPKKSPPSNGKKTKGRVKIKMEYIDNKLRRYTTFSKRKTGIMKKAYELSTLTGTQVMLLVASETGHVYTFATRKLQPMITSDSGKRLIQTCLNSPDPPQGAGAHGGDQRMSATGFEETELTYNIADDETKVERSPLSSAGEESGDESGSEAESPGQRQRSPSPEPSNSTREANAENNALFSAAGGVLYPPGVLLSLAAKAQEQGANPAQFITIPLSVAMAAAAASQQTTTVASLSGNHQMNGLQDLSRQSSRK